MDDWLPEVPDCVPEPVPYVDCEPDVSDWPEAPPYVPEELEPLDPVEPLVSVLPVLLWATNIAGTHKLHTAAVSSVFFIVLPFRFATLQVAIVTILLG